MGTMDKKQNSYSAATGSTDEMHSLGRVSCDLQRRSR